MKLRNEIYQWLQALGDLVFPRPPQCIMCNRSIHQEHFLNNPLHIHATGNCEVHQKESSTQLFANKLQSDSYRFIEKSRVDLSNQMCPKCFKGVRFIVEPFCQKCGRSLHFDINKCDGSTIQKSIVYCRDCSPTEKRYFEFSRAAVEYNEEMQELIHLFKYRGRRELADPLSIILYNALEKHYKNLKHTIDFIVPVPLHENRLAERGFNQATVLGKKLAEKTGISINEILIRVEYTDKQSKKTRADRIRPLENAFQLKNSRLHKEKMNQKDQHHLKGKNILLIDDIYTTGTTVNACAHILKQEGAKKVFVLTLAR